MIARTDKNGGPLHLCDSCPNGDPGEVRWRALQEAFESLQLHPGDLKAALESALMAEHGLGHRLTQLVKPRWNSEVSDLLDAAFPVIAAAAAGQTKQKATKGADRSSKNNKESAASPNGVSGKENGERVYVELAQCGRHGRKYLEPSHCC